MKLKYLSLILLVFYLCDVNAQNRPDWVEKRPASSMFYIGIARVMKSDKDYLQKAKQEALSDLVSEIQVTVASNSLLQTMEKESHITSHFEECIRLEAKQSIENFRLVDTWQNDTEYWVYYELNKFDYEEFIEKRREKAIQSGFDFWWQGQEAQRKGDLAVAVSFFLKGLEAIQAVVNEALLCEMEGKRIDVGQVLYSSLLNVFKGITIEVSPESIEGVPFQGISTPVMIQVSQEGIPLRNVGLHYAFAVGEGSLSENNVTDASGVARLYVRNITSKLPLQEIRVTLDQKIFGEIWGTMYETVLKAMEKSMPCGIARIVTEKSTVRAYLKTGKEDNETLKRVVSGILTNNYFDLTEDPAQADVLVLMQTNFKKGEHVAGEMYDFTAYYVDLSLRLINNRSNVELLKYGIDHMRNLVSAKSSATVAINAATREVVKRLNRELPRALQDVNISREGSINTRPEVLNKEPEKSEEKPTVKPIIVVVKSPRDTVKLQPKPEKNIVEAEFMSDVFVRYIGKKSYSDKTVLELKVINKREDDIELNLYHNQIKVINDKGEEMKIQNMKLGSAKNSFQVIATIVPDVPTTFLIEVKKMNSVKWIQISNYQGTLKLRNLE